MYQDAISMSVVVVYIIPIICYLYTFDSTHLHAFMGVIATMGLSEFIKYFIVKDKSIRPKGARNCNSLCNDGTCSGAPGMPSSHSAIVAFFAVFYINHTTNKYVHILLIIYALLVMLSRYLKRCHTIYQIGAGSVLGGLLGASLN